MIEQFIKETYLKKGETLEEGFKPVTENSSEYTVIRRTARTYKKMALIKITNQLHFPSTSPPADLQAYKFTMKTKRQLNESYSTIKTWLEEGWIIQEIRLDGLIAKEKHYRIGPRYIQYLFDIQQQKNENLEEKKKRISTFFQSCKFSHQFHNSTELLKTLVRQPIAELGQNHTFKSNWSIQKRQKFLLFCIGYFQLASGDKLFDYKQIGATVYQTIGGSKEFDREQGEFISELERIFNIDCSAYGLVSLGKIVPVFFSGHLKGNLSQYHYGAVHALTDDSLLQDHFTSEARYLFLVENRAVLTRMVKEPHFIEETKSLVLCLDGQIRTAHKMFIQQLMESTRIQKAIIWTDYDEAGLIIAKNAAQLVEGIQKSFIARDLTEIHALDQYIAWLEMELQQGKHEQEQQLGGEVQWRRWIQR